MANIAQQMRLFIYKYRILTTAQTQAGPSMLDAVGSITLHPHSNSPGELPPQPPRACFGRDELIERVVNLAENLTPLALIGAGGIGKTSIALTVLHHGRIRELFGDNRRFIRCDQFLPSPTHFLSRFSDIIGAGVKNPDNLAPLRPFLSSTRIIIVLDNAESILDPLGTHAQEIYDIVEELSRFSNICLCITSRISTIPPDCKALNTPTLSGEAAHGVFHSIYGDNEHPELVDNILEQLDFHPLSVTLLATVAHHNKWDSSRLAREWEQHRTGVLQTEYKRSLAATVELSLASPMFQDLGPNARGLLGVIAFFPHGVSENSINWLFPTTKIFNWSFSSTPPRMDIFDKFCVLSLTYRSNGFVRMLAPLRDYLCPKDPKLSPLLCKAKEYYFSQLSVSVDPDKSNFKGGQWITSEDMNVEHLLDVFTSIDPNSSSVWYACRRFMKYLYWHKPRLVVLGKKIEGLPDDYLAKPQCLYYLAQLFNSVGNNVECKQLLTHSLGLWRKQRFWYFYEVVNTLKSLSRVNMELGLYAEGIQQANQALRIHKWSFDLSGQARTLRILAQLLHSDGQLDAAEKAVSQAINFLSKSDQFDLCTCYTVLGQIHRSRGEMDTALTHFENALRIASSSDWQNQLSHIHHNLALLFSDQSKFCEANDHIEHAKPHTMHHNYNLGYTIYLQARIWYKECRFGEAKSEALDAVAIFEKLGAAEMVGKCENLLNDIEDGMDKKVIIGGSDSSGGFLDTVQPSPSADSPSIAGPSMSN